MVESVAARYLGFAAASPALYEVMSSLNLSVPFGDAATPPELRFAFSQLLELFQGRSSKPEVLSELFWTSLHGIAELTRTRRFPPGCQKERVRALVKLFQKKKQHGYRKHHHSAHGMTSWALRQTHEHAASSARGADRPDESAYV